MPYSATRDYVLAGLKDFYKEVYAYPDTGQGAVTTHGETVLAGQIPSGVGEVPLKIDYRTRPKEDWTLCGGFAGFTQDPKSKAVSPAVSWYVARADKQSNVDGSSSACL